MPIKGEGNEHEFDVADQNDVFSSADTKDHTDYLEVDNKRKTIWTVIGLIIVLIIAAVAAYFTMQVLDKDARDKELQKTENVVVLPEEQVDGGKPNPMPTSSFEGSDEERTMPLVELLETEEKPSEEPKTALYYGTQSVATNMGENVSFRGFTIDSPSTACTVVNVDDFCYSGKIESEGAGVFHTYLLKDISRSRFFDTAEDIDFNEGGAGSVVVTANIEFRESVTPVTAVVFGDNSGFMVIPEGSDDGTRNKSVADSVLVTAGGSTEGMETQPESE